MAVWRGDADRLRQILNNLLSNAVKFTLSGAVSAWLRGGRGWRAGAGGQRHRHRHRARDLPGLFDKFVQADATTTRKFGGTGLGLAICRELATLMGGAIDQGPEPGRRGSTFTLRLPRWAIGATLPGEPAPEAQARSARAACACWPPTTTRPTRRCWPPC
jgi:signal transduction histidine kinase